MRRWAAVLGGLLSGCVVGGGQLEYEFVDASSLTMTLTNGSVLVEAAEDPVTHVSWDGGGFGNAATPEVVEDAAGAVTIDASHPLGGGDVVAQVPAGVAVVVRLDRGDVTVDLDHPADLDLCVAAGSVDVTVPAGDYDLDVKLGAGAIDLELPDVDGAPYVITVCAGAGDVTIRTGDAGLD